MKSIVTAVVVTLAIMLPSLARAEGAPSGKSLANAAADPALKWGPCPPFIPAGCQIAVLHGDPSKANADVFFKVPANFTIPNHWHNSAERMVLVSGKLKVTYAGESPVTLEPGMYAYGPAKVAHEATCAKGDACILFIAFEAPVDAFPVEAKK
jgi:quercetin dioxygenase-like cupin family protein